VGRWRSSLLQHEEKLEKSQTYEEVQVFGTDTTVPCVFDLPNRVMTSFTLVRLCADSPASLLRPSLAMGHDADILDAEHPSMGYNAATVPYPHA
jgi:hypothetical protein